MTRKAILVVLLLAPLLALAGTITQTFTFSPDEVRFSKVNGYDVPNLRGYVSTSKPGDPILPQALLTFLVPPTATVTKVEVTGFRTTELPGVYNIHPAQTPRPLSAKAPVPVVGPSPVVYRSAQPFPGKLVEFGPTADKASYRLCGVSLFPLQYTPASGRLTLYTSLTVVVTYQENVHRAAPLTQRQLDAMGRVVRSLVCNSNDLKAFTPPVRVSTPVDAEYVIVTGDEYVTALQPLVDWHNLKGYTTAMKTVSWIAANYSGNDVQEQIRNFARDYFLNHGMAYLLLAGASSVIPDRGGYSSCGGYTDNIPTDLYYASYDWSWDGNGNHVYGEMNGDTVNFYYDVFVGRAPIASVTDAQTLVKKVLAYETTPDTGYVRKIYLPWVNLFTGYTGKVVSDAITAYAPGGWTTTEVNSPSTSAFMNAVNSGYGYCHAAAHGDDYGFYTDQGYPIYTTSEAAAQTNGMHKLMVLNSMACYSGNFEDQSCLSVTLQNNAYGGTVANMMNSRYGWGTPPSMGPSELLNLRFYDFLLNSDSFLLATAVQRGKEYYANLPYSQELWRWCYYEVNLLGDPAMPLWSDAPTTVSVARPDSILTGTQTIRFTVTSGGSPAGNAAVGIYKSGEVCARGLTDGAGHADILADPQSPGRLFYLVEAQNRLPVEDSIRVVMGTALPYITYQHLTIDDHSGNNNGRLDPGETADFLVTVKNIGSALASGAAGKLRTGSSYITLVDSTSDLGSINAGDTGRGTPYRVSASASTPPGTLANFIARVTANEGSWDLPFSVTVGQPHMPGHIWFNLDTADCVLSVTALGSIGKTGPDSQGDGFKFPKSGVSKFYYGGLLVGNSASYVVDRYYGKPASSFNHDFRLVDSVRQVVSPTLGDEEFDATFDDAGHPTPKGLKVIQQAVQVARPGYDEFTILSYDLVNQGASPLDGVYAGVMADFDVYSNGSNPEDIAGTCAEKNAAWQQGNNGPNPTLGLRLLRPDTASNLSVIDHAVYVYPTDTAMSENMKYRFLDGQLHAAHSNRAFDWSLVVAAGPFDIPSGGDRRVAFAILGGADTAAFLENSDSAEAWFSAHRGGALEPDLGVGGLARVGLVRVAPNPVKGVARIAYTMPEAGRLVIRAYDAGGRLVANVFDREVSPGSGTVAWRPDRLARGVYFLKAIMPDGPQTEKLLLMP